MKRDDTFNALFFTQSELRHLMVSREGERLVLVSINVLKPSPVRYTLSAKSAMVLAARLGDMIPDRNRVGDAKGFDIFANDSKLCLGVGVTDEHKPKLFLEVRDGATRSIEDVLVFQLNVGFTIREAILKWWPDFAEIAA